MSVQAIKAIDAIRFSIWSPTEIRKYSVAEITAPETYDEDGMPVQGGLMDGRLGVAYAFKLLLQEMQSLNIAPRLLIKEKI